MATEIGLNGFHYAILNSDTDTELTYATPAAVPGIIGLTINTNPVKGTLFADDGPLESAINMGEVTVDLELADVPYEVQAALLGHTLSAGGVLSRKSTDTAPYVAIGFKTIKSNGKYRYVWLTKGKFSISTEEHKTRTDQVTYNTAKLTGTFVKRVYDDEWYRATDEDATGFTEATATAWFTTVTTGLGATE